MLILTRNDLVRILDRMDEDNADCIYNRKWEERNE